MIGFITSLIYNGVRIIIEPFHFSISSARAMGKGELNTTISAQGTEETVTLGSVIESMRIELKGFDYNLEHQVLVRTRELSNPTEASRAEVAERKRLAGMAADHKRLAKLSQNRSKEMFVSTFDLRKQW